MGITAGAGQGAAESHRGRERAAARRQLVDMQLYSAMLFAKDLDSMTAFYRDVVGLQPIEETRLDNWVEFQGDGARFSLHAIPHAIAAGIRIDSPPRVRDQGGI